MAVPKIDAPVYELVMSARFPMTISWAVTGVARMPRARAMDAVKRFISISFLRWKGLADGAV